MVHSDMSIQEQIARKIKHAREVSGLSQAECAGKMGKSLKGWQNVEQGKVAVNTIDLHKFNTIVGNYTFDYYYDEQISIKDAIVSKQSFDDKLNQIMTAVTHQNTADPEANTLAQHIAASPQLRKLAIKLMEYPEDDLSKIEALVFAYGFMEKKDTDPGGHKLSNLVG